jgi:pilus assembly protein CpaE
MVMDETLQALCLSPDAAASAEVTALLARLPGFAVRSREADYQTGLRDLRDPDLAIVVLGAEPMLGLTVIEEVHRSSPSTRVLALSRDENPELIIKAMRAGADEFLPLPATLNALLKVCLKVSETRRDGARAHATAQGEVWTVYGPKGGVGVTTLVANLAFALRQVQRDAALVDLDTFSGDLAVFLNVNPTYTLRDIAADVRRLDSVFLQGTMTRHASGLELLAAPAAGPGETPLDLPGDHVRAILDLLRTLHEVTLVDTPGVPSPATLAALTCASRILLVTELTIPSLRSCLRTLEWFADEGIDAASRVEVIVNKYAKQPAEVPPAEAAKTLKLPIRAILPRDDATALAAVNSGVPLQEVRGGSPLHRAIAELVAPPAQTAETSTKRKGFMRLFSAAEKSA